jgi:hypothetical protein
LDNCATFTEWQTSAKSPHDAYSLQADPDFQDPTNADYTVKNPTVLALGIEPLNLTDVGPDWK